MGRRGNPFAKAESFMKMLKAEIVYPMSFEIFTEHFHTYRGPFTTNAGTVRGSAYLSPQQLEDEQIGQTGKTAT